MSGWNQSDLNHLAHELGQRMNAERAIAAQVHHLRAQGCPWSIVAETLGVTKQAAQQRYGKQPATPLEAPETEPMF